MDVEKVKDSGDREDISVCRDVNVEKFRIWSAVGYWVGCRVEIGFYLFLIYLYNYFFFIFRKVESRCLED